jgi:hypothetical protein
MNAYAIAGGVDGSNLKLSLTPSTRYFVRFGVGLIDPKDSASSAKDISGPVVPYQALKNIVTAGPGATQYPGATSSENVNAWVSAIGLKSAIDADVAGGDMTNVNGVGIPPGVSQKASGSGGTAFLSLGMYLDEAKKWSAETFVLGVPVKLNAKGAGTIAPHDITYKDNLGVTHTTHLDLGRVGSTKILPLTAIFNYSFFDKDAKWRPTLGAMLTYNIFLESELSTSFQNYAGGPSKIKLKNAPGFGPIVGLDYRIDDRWTINARVGYKISKTTGTVTTQTDPVTLANSQVLLQAEGNLVSQTNQAFYKNPAQTVPLFRAIAYQTTGDPNNMGSYTRTFKYRTNALVVLVSLGYDF